MAKCVVWCRVSTTAQEFESQKLELIKQAQDDGFALDEILPIGKAGASAIKLNALYQQEVDELLSALDKDDEIKTIYVWEVSRLARNEKAFYMMKDVILKKHIQFICRVPEIKLLDKDGSVNQGMEITLSLLITLARQEMEIKKARFSRGKKEGARQNKFTGGNVPFGYRVDDKKNIVIDEVNGEIVKQIFEEYKRGMSTLQIAKYHQSIGQKDLKLTYVGKILRSRFYTGEPTEERQMVQVVKGEEVKWTRYSRTYQPIVSKELFDECREIAKTNNTKIIKAKRNYYAGNLIKCPNCGHFFKAVPSKAIYGCGDYLNTTKKYDGYDESERCKSAMTLSINVIDSLLWYVGVQLEVSYIAEMAEADISKYQAQIDTLQRQIENIPNRLHVVDDKLEKVQDVYIEGNRTKEWYNVQKENIRKERNAILNENNQYVEQIKHIQSLIDGVLSRTYVGTSAITDLSMRGLSLLEQIVSIENDANRCEIIHRHIQWIDVEYVNVPYHYSIYAEPKNVEGKLLTIHCYNGEVIKYIYVPFAGNGKGYLQVNEDGSTEQIEIPYICRFIDKGKKRRQEKKREKQKQKRIQDIEERQQEYLTIPEVAKLVNKDIHTIQYDIEQGYLKAEKQSNRRYLIKISDFNEYQEWRNKRGNTRIRKKS